MWTDDEQQISEEERFHKTIMAHLTLFDILAPFPVMSVLAEQLDYWDVIQLSRTCVSIRAICHGFSEYHPGHDFVKDTNIRRNLHIGLHNSSTWKLYKSLTIKQCREPDHTRGRAPLGCKICSKPVCLACIVKHSIGKRENTFHCRGRALCKDCFNTGNPHSRHVHVRGGKKVSIDYLQAGLCQCTSNDGILCVKCKTRQNDESTHRYKKTCAGVDCTNSLPKDSSSARICLWCDSIFPTASRQSYDTSLGDVLGTLKDSRPIYRTVRTRDDSWIKPPDEPMPTTAVPQGLQDNTRTPPESDRIGSNDTEVPPYTAIRLTAEDLQRASEDLTFTYPASP